MNICKISFESFIYICVCVYIQSTPVFLPEKLPRQSLSLVGYSLWVERVGHDLVTEHIYVCVYIYIYMYVGVHTQSFYYIHSSVVFLLFISRAFIQVIKALCNLFY